MTFKPLLICSAFQPELNLILSRLEMQEQGRHRLWTGTIGPQPIVAITIGVGLIRAAATLAAILERISIGAALFTGTAGAVDIALLPLKTIIRARTIALMDFGQLQNHSYVPDIMETRITPQHIDLRFPIPISEGDVVCPLGITRTVEGNMMLKQRYGNVVENLEAFAVGLVSSQYNVPCEVLLGVSNAVGPNGHQEWRENHQSVSAFVQEQILRWIQSLRSPITEEAHAP